MPAKLLVETEDIGMEDDLHTSMESTKAIKVEKNKNGKIKKKKKPVEDETDEQDPPAPKKKKKDDTANGKLPKKKKLDNGSGNLTNGTPLMKITSASSEVLQGSDTEKKSKKQLKEASANGIVHNSTVSSPSHSSDDSTIDKEPELTPEQKEGAFSNFRISKETIKLLQARGATYLFDIQARTFDSVYDGKDVVAQARTGTGKTFSFAIPLIERLSSSGEERKRGRPPKVLVLAPTRELAIQVAKDFKDVTRRLSVACFYGGSSYNPQMDSIRNGIDILVGTPGRIKDLYQNSKLDLTQLKHVVLDEVDQMLDMGFAEQVEEILAASYKKDSETNPQTLLFSATCPHWVYDVAKKYMRPEFEHVDLIGKKTQKTATTVEHLAITCHWSQRAAVIGDVVQVYSGSEGRTIIFCETKKEASELSLSASIKQNAQTLHGDIPQKQREITLKGFRNGVFGVLVATNVAARGLDIPEVDLVIQCSPPNDVESYIHRSGRTGRAGRTGICICLYQRREEDQLRFVEQKAGITFKRVGVPTANDIIKASSKEAFKLLDSVPSMAIEYFRASAEKLIEERGAVNALAAALARISGATVLEQRSLLTADTGYITFVLKCSQEIHSISYAWKALKEQLGEEIDDQVQRMTFLKGKTGVCFDVPTDKAKNIEETWQNGRRWQLFPATELPELEETNRPRGDRSSGGGRSFRSGGWSGGRGGRGGRGRGGGQRDRGGRPRGGGRNSGNGKGQKRTYSTAFSY